MSYEFHMRHAGVRRRAARAHVQRLACAVAALLVLVPAGPAGASIALDATSVANDNTSTLMWTHTIGPGLDRYLVVGVSLFSDTKTVSTAYAGAPMTFLGALDGGQGADARRVELWGLASPAVGPAQVIVELSGGSKVIGGAASFFGVDPAAPTGGFVSGEGEGTSATLTVASAAGEVVFDCISTKGTANVLTPGAGQTEAWNDVTRTNGGNVMGAASYAPGAVSTTMSWTLQDPEYWVLAATTLLPAPPRPYLADAMIRLSTEPDAAYRYDAVYEPTASVQVATADVLGTQTVACAIRFENDGINPDAFRISGTGSSADFAVQYIDGGGVDRTLDVVGAGYVDAVLAPGGSALWTLNVTPLPGAAGGASHTVAVTATSTGDPLWSDQVAAVTTSTSPALAVSKSVDLAGAAPGQDVTYTMVATTAPGLSDATSIVLVDSLPPDVGFLVGSAVFDPGTTSLTSTVLYSSDNGATWTYSPGSGACGAPGGYDYCVTHVRWELAGDMPADQTFSVAFIAHVR